MEVSSQNPIFAVFLLNFIHVFGTCFDKIEKKTPKKNTTHARVSPLSTFIPSHVAQEVDSGVWWVVG